MCPSSKSCSQMNSIFDLIGPRLGIAVLIFFFIANFKIHSYLLSASSLCPSHCKKRGKVNWKGLFSDGESRACLRCRKKWWFLLQEMALVMVFVSSPILHLVVHNTKQINIPKTIRFVKQVVQMWSVWEWSILEKFLLFFFSSIFKTYWRNMDSFPRSSKFCCLWTEVS